MADLDGVWDVRRVSGALPPLNGVRKRIDGDHGETLVVRGPGMPFEVRGLELRYRAPFAFLVDRLEPSGGGFRGTATAFGRVYGEFELRRSPMGDIQAQLVKHIDEAHALEQSVLRMLDSMIQTTDDAEILDRLEHHKLETLEHATTMKRRLEYHGAEPSMVRQAAGMLEALMKMPLDLATPTPPSISRSRATSSCDASPSAPVTRRPRSPARRSSSRSARWRSSSRTTGTASSTSRFASRGSPSRTRNTKGGPRRPSHLCVSSRRPYFSQGARKLSISRQPRGFSSRARTTLSSTTTSVGIVATSNRLTRSGRSCSSTR
jgi:hypothetical protein